jgi:hypothetical protein
MSVAHDPQTIGHRSPPCKSVDRVSQSIEMKAARQKHQDDDNQNVHNTG